MRWPDTNTKGNTSESAKISLNTLWAPCLYANSHMLSLSILVEDHKAKILLTHVFMLRIGLRLSSETAHTIKHILTCFIQIVKYSI